MAKRKWQKCLRCDRPHLTTPEWRICHHCKNHANDIAKDKYPLYAAAVKGMELRPRSRTLFNSPINTRGGNT